jgi:hypothetical protein
VYRTEEYISILIYHCFGEPMFSQICTSVAFSESIADTLFSITRMNIAHDLLFFRDTVISAELSVLILSFCDALILAECIDCKEKETH